MEQRSPAAYVAEFIGTFALVFFITSVVILFVNPQGTGSDWAVVGLVQGLALFMLVATIANISGAHVNPAVTLAQVALRKIKPNDAVVYILLQLAGGVGGALFTKFLLDDAIADGANVGTPALNDSLLGSTLGGVFAEGIGAFFLVWAVIAVLVNPRGPRDWAAPVIGGTLALVVMTIGPLTGASVNPARWFGPALVANEWDDFWVYIVGPVVGGVLAALLYWYLFVESKISGTRAPGGGSTGVS